jgi:hypothetical protein
MIYIAMMSRTDEPLEGVVFNVQDHARQDRVVTSPCTEKKKDALIRTFLAET